MYHTKTNFYFIGIGGIGMSALAIILKQQGYSVTGSDENLKQKSVLLLQKIGCHVDTVNIESSFLKTATVVIYSAAVSADHPELIQARKLNIATLTRAQLLAELFNKKEGIAVAGSHGKTTTSSLIAHVVMQAKLDPTFAIGGHLHTYATNARHGSSDFFIAEACENDKTITHLKPSIAIITNIDREHLDVYKDIEEIKETFLQYINNVPFYGKIIACFDEPHTRNLIESLPAQLQKKVITYGFSPQADIFIEEHTLHSTSSTATVRIKNSITPLGTITLSIPGKHNLLNMLAVIATAQEIGIPFQVTAHACATFEGVDRRFTFKGLYKQATVYDDYGHHPAEIEQIVPVAYKKAQEQGGKLIILFQPHRFSRTEKLWNEFIDVFSKTSYGTLIITDIYGAFEEPIYNVTSQNLAQAIHNNVRDRQVIYAENVNSFEKVKKALDMQVQSNDLILFLGAGKINILAEKLCP